MAVRTIWNINTLEPDEKLIESCGGNRVLACLLMNRGINTPEKVNNFLNPLKVKLIDTSAFKDIEKAFERVKKAIENGEHITVYGDFDADGVTSTSLLYLTLKEIGADVDFYLPDRDTESHGLNTKALVNLISKKHTKLIITVDCGISNVKEVSLAKGLKTDIIITDHHEAPEVLPEAFAILNPKAPDSVDSSLDIEDIQSLNYLSGVGVAFKFACKLLQEFKKENSVNRILPLVAVGTIGDVVELLGENRTLVSMGLELIRNSAHKGLTKMLVTSGFEDITKITAENIAFSVVPRLNAAGRLENPDTAINLLISDDDEEIDKAVSLLNDLNTLRQKLCEETYNTAESMYKSDLSHNKNAIILLNEDWHIGIIGIVASKLVEKFNKPVFLMTKDTNFPNIIRCSCRSIQNINVHAVLSAHKELFEGFGGHKMAAGFSFDETKTGFEKFRSILSSTIEEQYPDIDFRQVYINADMELEADDINIETVNLLQKLEPFGSANPSPLFVMNNAVLNSFRMMGQNNNHLKMSVSKNNSASFECVKWSTPDFNLPVNSNIDLLFSLKLNSFNGKETVQLMVNDFHSELIKESRSEIKMLDHRNKKGIINQVLDFVNTTKKKTGIFIESPALIKELNMPETVNNKLFSHNEIPSDIEQLMFFDAPATQEDFINILKSSGAQIIHLMNFNVKEINTDDFLSKLSGMLKYSITNLNGEINIKRLTKALCVDNDTVECALSLFDDMQMIDLNKLNEFNYKISFVHPLELSKIKINDLYAQLDEQISNINNFRKFYLNSTIEEIKDMVVC